MVGIGRMAQSERIASKLRSENRQEKPNMATEPIVDFQGSFIIAVENVGSSFLNDTGMYKRVYGMDNGYTT